MREEKFPFNLEDYDIICVVCTYTIHCKLSTTQATIDFNFLTTSCAYEHKKCSLQLYLYHNNCQHQIIHNAHRPSMF